jgi:hypothetical protein
MLRIFAFFVGAKSLGHAKPLVKYFPTVLKSDIVRLLLELPEQTLLN